MRAQRQAIAGRSKPAAAGLRRRLRKSRPGGGKTFYCASIMVFRITASLVAAGVTFYSLLAIFPGIAALISIYGLFADPATVASHLDTIASVAPSGRSTCFANK